MKQQIAEKNSAAVAISGGCHHCHIVTNLFYKTTKLL